MPELITTKQAARMAGCHICTIAKWVHSGRLKAARAYGVGTTNGYRFTVDAVWEAITDKRSARQRRADAVADWLVDEFGLERVE